MIPLVKRATVVAAVLVLLPLAGSAWGQPDPVEDVLCPVFIPEFPAKHCITLTGRGCVHIVITTFGVPGDPEVNRKVCPLP